mgnify:FL=1|jgi:hypothetical protein
MRDEVNKILSDYLVPITCLVMIMGVVVGLIKNWDAINDANSSGRRKEGLFNVGHIVMYAFIGIAIIGLIMTALTKLTMKI